MKRFCRRSWGWWTVLWNAKHFKVKLLKFNDRCTCSLQYHALRNELWLFLYGKGQFQCGPFTGDVAKGDYKIVREMERHKFYSIGCSWVLEIQYGELCSEEDIVRV